MSLRPKRITGSSIIGEQGIALIHQRVLEMGYLWYPTTASIEAGIDGLIELRDPATGAVRNAIVQVQSKATQDVFDGETDSGFFFVCNERDLDYWLNGNAPVILVRSRPKTQEAYWVSLKDYFSDPSRRKSRKIAFNKATNKFDISAQHAIWSLAFPKDAGIFLPPLPKTELLHSNLLPVVGFADTMYVAETEYRIPGQVWSEFKRRDVRTGREWFLKDGRIFSFQPLDEHPFSEICEQGTVERFNTDEWARSDSIDRRRDFVRLLNQCLSSKLFRIGVKFDDQRAHYYFRATENLSTRKEPYSSLSNRHVHREVFRGYASLVTPERIAYYRHSAFEGQFLTFDGSWFLQITPTYRFTWDGYHIDGSADVRLAGIKRLERNGAVLGQLVMWAALLSKPPDLFNRYTFLEFGTLQPFRFEYGIDDARWLPAEEPEEAAKLNVDDEGLFA
jgi:Domain of unknown function (DUF4365)